MADPKHRSPPNPTGKGGFKKGISANPSGRAKPDYDLVNAAKAQTQAAIATLAEIMKDKDAPHSSRITAAIALLDRGHGKAHQSVALSGDINATLTLVQATALDEKL